MKKYLVAGVFGIAGILVGILVKSGVGVILAIVLVAIALVVAFGKIGFIDNLIDSAGKKQKYANPAEEAVDKAVEFLNQGKAMDAINQLEEAAEIVESSEQYIYYGVQALRMLGEFYETGVYGNSTVQVNNEKAIGYYERSLALEPDGEIYFKVARDLLTKNNFSKALSGKGSRIKGYGCIIQAGKYL